MLAGACCGGDRKVDVVSKLHPESMPMMSTRNVSTLISDSGVVQYKIVCPLWEIFDNDTPSWFFPQGVYLQKYDRDFKVIATVAADSARYYTNPRLWKLMGRVEVTKDPADLFLSERLYWDTRHERVYSDTFIHIENATHVLEGIGFESNQQFTEYRVLKPQGIFPAVNPADEDSKHESSGNDEGTNQ